MTGSTWAPEKTLHYPSSKNAQYLDTVLKQESWHGEALFFVKRLTENDNLFEEEDPPLFAARQKSRVLVCDQECVLQEQLALGNNFTLKRVKGDKGRGENALRYMKFCFL